MSEAKRTIETRPTLSIDVRDPEAPPHPQVAFFDATALLHTAVMKKELANWPPQKIEADRAEPRGMVQHAITSVLAASKAGRLFDYDNNTWGILMTDTEYSDRANLLANFKRPEGNPGADVLREQVAVHGLGLYVEQLATFRQQNPPPAWELPIAEMPIQDVA